MDHRLDHTIALLTRTPAALDALLRDLPEDWTLRGEGPGTWSAHGIVGHLIHAEHADWIPRARLILQHGERRAFEPFDRLGHVKQSEGRSLNLLLDEFAEARSQSLRELHALNIRDEDLSKRGRHPVLGAVTLSHLLATWAAHDLTHLHQLSRVLAHQYREAVGSWSAYLGVMQCKGHGS
jgi:hypothetical protein